MKNALIDDLTRYMEANFPILYLNTVEEEQADQAITAAAEKNRRGDILEWNGFHAVDFQTKAPLDALDDSMIGLLRIFLLEDAPSRILVLKEPQAYFDQPEVLALLRDIALRITTGKLSDCTVLIVSSTLLIPKEIEHYITVLESEPLTYSEIAQVVRETAEEWAAELPESILGQMSTAFKGLSESEIRNILALAYNQYEGVLDRQALSMIFRQKQQTIRKSGILEMIELRAGMDDIGGLENLKEWLKRKASIFKNIQKAQAFGVDMPKGVLIAGLPGCGKSLSAKATAKLLEVPLLRLDIGRLMGKYVGESEANMRRAISLAEAISPCVLWIDELEKAFAGIGGDSGAADVATRLFGTFLTWLQEKESPVFVVATANDISKLPPELLRKGRFDEIFYVQMPKLEERKKILEIHIRKRRPQDFAQIDVNSLARATDGYSGADLEGIVRDSIESAFAAGKARVETTDLNQAIRNTQSSSKVMEEAIEKMKKEYEKRQYKNASR